MPVSKKKEDHNRRVAQFKQRQIAEKKRSQELMMRLYQEQMKIQQEKLKQQVNGEDVENIDIDIDESIFDEIESLKKKPVMNDPKVDYKKRLKDYNDQRLENIKIAEEEIRLKEEEVRKVEVEEERKKQEEFDRKMAAENKKAHEELEKQIAFEKKKAQEELEIQMAVEKKKAQEELVKQVAEEKRKAHEQLELQRAGDKKKTQDLMDKMANEEKAIQELLETATKELSIKVEEIPEEVLEEEPVQKNEKEILESKEIIEHVWDTHPNNPKNKVVASEGDKNKKFYFSSNPIKEEPKYEKKKTPRK